MTLIERNVAVETIAETTRSRHETRVYRSYEKAVKPFLESTCSRRHSIPTTACLLLALLLPFLAGCNAVRAQIGVGMGIGAQVKIPATLHTGICFGSYRHMGFDYGRGLCMGERFAKYWKVGCFIVCHNEFYADDFMVGTYYTAWAKHSCAALLPFLYDKDYPEEDVFGAYSLEVDVAALLLDIRLGINFKYLIDGFWVPDEDEEAAPEPEDEEPAEVEIDEAG